MLCEGRLQVRLCMLIPCPKLNELSIFNVRVYFRFYVSGCGPLKADVAYALPKAACINRAELLSIVFRRSCAHFKALLQSGFVHALYKVKVILLYLNIHKKITPHRDNTVRGGLRYAII